MLVSMIHYNTSNGEESKVEIPIADSVRYLIVNFLRDGKEKRFSEITSSLGKKDNVVNRELKELIERGWVIKTNGYKLDLSRDDVKEYLRHSDVAIPENSTINEIEFDYEKLDSIPPFYERAEKMKEETERFINQYPENLKYPEIIEKMRDATNEAIRRLPSSSIFYNTKIFLVMDKNNTPEIKFSKIQYEKLISIMENITQEPYDKPFKIIISYDPK